jgi:hypothetical protein
MKTKWRGPQAPLLQLHGEGGVDGVLLGRVVELRDSPQVARDVEALLVDVEPASATRAGLRT